MNEYVISALKYRPTEFNEVIGQSSITQTLTNAINLNQLPQALLFCGPRGVGKTSCARILARKINNQEKEDDIKFNVFELDAASNNSVDDIRNLNEQVRIPPQVGKYKIYIIDEAHMLSTSAFNAFLKTLEEPPKHAIFILATTEKNKIIPTILSRCQIYDFKSISSGDIALHLKNISLKNNIKFEDQALNIISETAEGAMRDALSLYDRLVNLTNANLTTLLVSENLSILNHEIYIQLTEKLLNNNIADILINIDEILKKGFSHLDFLSGLSNYFRNLMLSKNKDTLKFINSKEPVLNKIILQSDKLEMKTIIKSISIINSSEIKYKQSKNKRLHIEFCLLDIAEKLSNSKKKTKIIKQSFEEENITNNASFSETNENQNLKKPNKIELKNKDASENKNVSGLSLSSIKFKKENEKIQLEKQQSSEKKKLNEIFTKKDLIDVWNSYLQDKLKNGDKNIASILKINTPSIENKNLINFSVLNDSNKIELEEEKTNLLLFLRKHLKNDEINLKITVNKLDIKKTEYSDKEKYKILLKKNSQLDILRTTFDLEF
tara:strand:+ start:1509 stop:3164 length:1656 start_codon:yes stop_codon:yes gene_type:complete